MKTEKARELVRLARKTDSFADAHVFLNEVEAELAALEADNARMREALEAIDGPCERLTSGRCIDDYAYYIGAEFGADAVCYPCIANRALAERNSRGTESH